MKKGLILSGIQPSGILTLGNYLGALRNWVDIQEEYECMYFIADLHAITVPQDPKELRENTKKALMQYLACGLDPSKNVRKHQEDLLQASVGMKCSVNLPRKQRTDNRRHQKQPTGFHLRFLLWFERIFLSC